MNDEQSLQWGTIKIITPLGVCIPGLGERMLGQTFEMSRELADNLLAAYPDKFTEVTYDTAHSL
jgi:hypothetical protein